jgi:hypothetical protein
MGRSRLGVSTRRGIGADYLCKRLCPLRHRDGVFCPLSIELGSDLLAPYINLARAHGAEARRKKPAEPDDDGAAMGSEAAAAPCPVIAQPTGPGGRPA